MVRIVVEENQFLCAAFHYDVDGFAPVAVSPALFARGIFFRKILRVVDQQVSAFSQLADAFIKHRIARLIVRGVNNDLALGFHAEAKAALRMVEPHGLHGAAFKLVRPSSMVQNWRCAAMSLMFTGKYGSAICSSSACCRPRVRLEE